VPLDKSAIAALIPHAGAMCLLDEVTSWDAARVNALCRTHGDTRNPLRTEGGLFTLSAIEYAAQAMAVHGALVGAVSGRPRAGYLVSLRNVVCGAARLDGLQGDLVVEAEQLAADGERVMYAFSLRVGDSQVAMGNATVMLDIEGSAA
jgi:predicted hotdog family 3-hydroxylacyl-ACP dehydratase